MELDGQRPLAILQELFAGLSEKDRRIFRHSLFLGVVMDPRRQSYGPGDFLIRNILAADEESGCLAVGALIRENAVVQFHLRDADTSAEDLDSLLARHVRERGESEIRPAGALLFSCLGRGSHLYGRADHDTQAFRRRVGEVPLGGFFCNGEIGPVQGRTYLHGYTSAFGLFHARS
jgi:small ligand-binding sensory domain FIST